MNEEQRGTKLPSVGDYFSATQLRADRWSALRETTESMLVHGVEGRQGSKLFKTAQALFDAGLSRDVYLVLGDQQESTVSWAVRSYLKPLANWIWIGSFVMAFGGLISLTDRRFRVGAAARRRRTPVAVPAE